MKFDQELSIHLDTLTQAIETSELIRDRHPLIGIEIQLLLFAYLLLDHVVNNSRAVEHER